MKYQDINAKTINQWCEDGWQWGTLISHQTYLDALNGTWNVLLTPTKYVLHHWFGNLKDKQVLGLTSGGQQLPFLMH